jgi:hypothetical protein
MHSRVRTTTCLDSTRESRAHQVCYAFLHFQPYSLPLSLTLSLPLSLTASPTTSLTTSLAPSLAPSLTHCLCLCLSHCLSRLPTILTVLTGAQAHPTSSADALVALVPAEPQPAETVASKVKDMLQVATDPAVFEVVCQGARSGCYVGSGCCYYRTDHRRSR